MEEKKLNRIDVIDIAEQQPYFTVNNGYIGVEIESDGTVAGDITLLQSFSGSSPEDAATNWNTAVDVNGDDIVETLTAGGSVLFNVCGISEGSFFAFKFAATTGEVTIYTKGL